MSQESKKTETATAEKKPKKVDTPEELAIRYNFFKSQAEHDLQELQKLELVKNDHLVAKATLSSIQQVEKDNDLLLPIGGNVFVNGTLSDPENVLMEIGSGVAVRKSVPDAIAKLDSLLEELANREKELASNIKFYENEIQEMLPKIQKYQERFQAQRSGTKR